MSATDDHKPIPAPANGAPSLAKVQLDDAFTTDEFDDEEEFDLTSASVGFGLRKQLEQEREQEQEDAERAAEAIDAAEATEIEIEIDGEGEENEQDVGYAGHMPEMKSPVRSPNFVLRRSADATNEQSTRVVATPPVSPFAVVHEEHITPRDIPLSFERPRSSKGSAHEAHDIHRNEHRGSVLRGSLTPSADANAGTIGSADTDGSRSEDIEHNHNDNDSHGHTPPRETSEDEDAPVQLFEDISLEEEPEEDHEQPQLTARSAQSARSPTPPHSGTPMHSTQPSQSNSPGGQELEFNLPAKPGSTVASPTAPTSFQMKFRPTKDRGGSALEKVMSKTRPIHLPPKPKAEDKKHLRDWEEMMKKSREAEEKRKEEFMRRKEARAQAVEESIPVWEREIIPDWRNVFRQPKLRQMWWKGIPTKLRGQLWEKAVGNPLQLSKEAFRIRLARGKRAIERETFPADALAQIEEDMDTTLPTLHLFQREIGVMRQDLQDLLIAWTVARSDEGLGYVLGAARVGAMLLINIPAPQTFITMCNFLDRHCLRSLYRGQNSKEDVEAYYRIFDTLLANSLPKVYFNFKQHHVSPAEYLPQWFLAVFLDHLPFETCARLWDVVLLEGDSFLFRAALAIFGVLESRLFFPDRDELIRVLKGESTGAIEVAKRTSHVSDITDLGARYEVYGLDEETLWERIDASEEMWRESTWSRLIQRELPDL